MSDAISKLIAQSIEWAQDAQAAGWLRDEHLLAFQQLQQHSPKDLFENEKVRPLVVGLFGGTGVGKSSLLNRLAGHEVARTGVVRPTSTEVTVFVHETVALADLPERFPADRTHIKPHNNERHKDLLWLDMPDIDSTRQDNQQLTLDWLDHIDLLIYVVSPERYRDDIGWRMLKDHGKRHAWMFVMNRIDEGDTQQTDDFVSILGTAGFSHPQVFQTSCAANDVDDDFEQIERTIHQLLHNHGIAEFERLGLNARIQDAENLLSNNLQRFGSIEQWKSHQRMTLALWQQTRRQIEQDLGWPIKHRATEVVKHPGKLNNLLSSQPARDDGGNQELSVASPTDDPTDNGHEANLWDQWSQSRLIDVTRKTEIAVSDQGIASQPYRQQLAALMEQIPDIIEQHLQQNLRRAMTRPGTPVQRATRKTAGFLRSVLPVCAASWVAYIAFTRFHSATFGEGEFLGINFAVNSLLIVASSWLIPYLLHRQLEPSLIKTAQRGLTAGLNEGLDAVELKLAESFDHIIRQSRVHVDKAEGLLDKLTARYPAQSADEIARLMGK